MGSLLSKAAVLLAGLLVASQSNSAGLQISNIPLYVTQPLAPNVIISPVFNTEFNEVSLRNAPWSVFVGACNNDDREQPCSLGRSNNSWQNGAPFYKYNLGSYGWRVTPWPAGDKEGARITSDVALYPHDKITTDGVTQLVPLDYRPGQIYQYATEEQYPESKVLHPAAAGKARYARSDLNFLYYNKSVAETTGYSPWPALGDWKFTTYRDAEEAANPKYHPIAEERLKARLDAAQNRVTLHCDPKKDKDECFPQIAISDVDALIGQYWTYNKRGNVWNSASYTQTLWGAMKAEEKIQFAHWFTYWRSADLASRGMVARLIKELGQDRKDLLSRLRLGIFHMDRNGERKVSVTAAGSEASRVQTLADIIYRQDNVFTSVVPGKTLSDKRRVTSTVWNPYETIKYFTYDAPYRDDPGDESSPIRSCRRNYEIILTPDYSGLRLENPNTLAPRSTKDYSGNYDSALGSPYADSYDNTLGDVGAYGWKTDLKDKLENNILASKNDKQTAQHLVRYVIGPSDLGLVFNRKMVSYDDALSFLTNNPASGWADPNITLLPGLTVIDDLWHMVLNSRGYFYGGENVSDALDKLLQSLNDILVANVSGSSIATSTTSLSTNDLIYQASVESDWKGHLRAFRVAKELNADNKDVLNVDFKTPVWDLAERISAQDWRARNIATYSGSSGIAFRWDSLNDDIRDYFRGVDVVPRDIENPDVYGAKLLEYLRGSGECEDGSGTNCSSGVSYVFRRRNIERNNNAGYSSRNLNGRNVLGDIANSNPWLIAPPVAGWSDVDYPGYNAFRVANKSRQSVLYVGANDGMLHAVNASNGDELFGYIPGFVHANLNQLAKPSYGPHTYYVDGSPFSANVKVGDSWKTLLAGGANKGGRGYYLLDVTTPTTNTEANAADWVKWEFTHPDLHYSYNLPVADRFGQARQFVRTNDAGKWALIVGNGYPEAANKQACLFIIYVTGPSGEGKAWVENRDYRKLCAGGTDYSVDGGLDTNGLSTPTPYDTNGDGKVDVIYAGDLNGNLWRFDVGSSTPGEWTVAYSDTPVFVAKNAAGTRQPIISPPEVTTLVAGSTVGRLILLGTGKYLEETDLTSSSTQSFYGVWDRGFAGITRSHLVAQVLDSPESVNDVVVRRQTNKSHPAYCSAAADLAACATAGKNLGWYWDMPTSGERQTGKSSLINGVVFFNTFYPEWEPYNVVVGEKVVTKYRLDPCEYGGEGWLMGLNAVNGYMEDRFSVFDVNQDGVVDETSDAKVAGVRVGASMGGTTFAKGLTDTMVGLYSPSNKEQTDKNNKAIIKIDPASSGRVSWFELLD